MEMDIKDVREMQRSKLVKKQNVKKMPVDRIWPILKMQEDMAVNEVGGCEFSLGDAYIFCKQVNDVFVWKFTDEGIKKHVEPLKSLYLNETTIRRRNGSRTVIS